jgi:hypothetical protein
VRDNFYSIPINPESFCYRINVFTATPSELDSLTDACQPAPFGRGAESVLDDAYRKAGKLDLNQFSSNFDLHSTKIPDIVASALMVGATERGASATTVRFEPYKLNVYGRSMNFFSNVYL